MGKMLIAVGIILVLIGSIMYFTKGIPFLGKLPGDIHIKRENFSFYFPLGTSILISIILSIILYLIHRLR